MKSCVAYQNIPGYKLYKASRKSPGSQKTEVEIPTIYLMHKSFEIFEMRIQYNFHGYDRFFCGNSIK